MRRGIVVGAVALAGWAGACTKVGGDPNAVVALSFDALPFPAIVIGDTLRDETGVPVTLTAVALNPEGEVIPDAQITFLSLDPGVTVSPDGFLISNPGTALSVRVVAEAGGLQSRPLALIITPAPDSMAQDGIVDTISYSLANEAQNVSQAITVKLFNTEVTPPIPATGWIVHFSLEYHGVPEASATSQRAWLVDEANRRSDVDTADAQGHASRRLRIAPGANPGLNDPDSIVVIATAAHRGLELRGAPVRIVVHIRARL